MIGGGGEKKTLRLVAQYADACNVFGNPQMLSEKLDVLRRHCDDVGRDYDEITKTVYYPVSVGRNGERAQQVIDELSALAEAGAQAAIGAVRHVVGKEIIPAIADL